MCAVRHSHLRSWPVNAPVCAHMLALRVLLLVPRRLHSPAGWDRRSRARSAASGPPVCPSSDFWASIRHHRLQVCCPRTRPATLLPPVLLNHLIPTSPLDDLSTRSSRADYWLVVLPHMPRPTIAPVPNAPVPPSLSTSAELAVVVAQHQRRLNVIWLQAPEGSVAAPPTLPTQLSRDFRPFATAPQLSEKLSRKSATPQVADRCLLSNTIVLHATTRR